MKITVAVGIIAVLLAMLIPVFTVSGGESGIIVRETAAVTEAVDDPVPSEQPETAASEAPTGSITADLRDSDSGIYDSSIGVRLLCGDEVLVLSMYEYLCGVVAAEMPVSFEREALKAQAVAARTYTLYTMMKGSNHGNADVCGNANCCKAYLNEAELAGKWADRFSLNMEIISKAVRDTDGLYLSYGGEPILAVFHSSSSGYTENSEDVWSRALPYLVSVESPETEKSVPNYLSEVELSHEEFKSTVLQTYPSAVLNEGEAWSWLEDERRSEAGRIISIKVGGIELGGTEFRVLFGLRSTAVSWSIGDDWLRFEIIGYGHGVGMSQYGANEFAKNGAGFQDILTYYYKDTEIKDLKEFGSDEGSV